MSEVFGGLLVVAMIFVLVCLLEAVARRCLSRRR